jgi:hypothetical protein
MISEGAPFDLTINLIGQAITQVDPILLTPEHPDGNGALVGELELIGRAFASVWPALWLCQWTRVGKGTAFGLGGYHINEPMRDASSDRPPRDVPTDR